MMNRINVEQLGERIQAAWYAVFAWLVNCVIVAIVGSLFAIFVFALGSLVYYSSPWIGGNLQQLGVAALSFLGANPTQVAGSLQTGIGFAAGAFLLFVTLIFVAAVVQALDRIIRWQTLYGQELWLRSSELAKR